jgi:hypothetical protein
MPALEIRFSGLSAHNFVGMSTDLHIIRKRYGEIIEGAEDTVLLLFLLCIENSVQNLLSPRLLSNTKT